MMDPALREALETFDRDHIGRSKGSLSFALAITRRLRGHPLPFDPADFRTAKQGQVKGLGGSATQRVLRDHGIDRVLSAEGGRTSRGMMGKLEPYAGLINRMHEAGILDLDAIEEFWVERTKDYWASEPFTFKLDPSKSLRACVGHLLDQAAARQREAQGTMYVGAVMQHLVGAKLDLITESAVKHHGFSVADAPSNRSGDFIVGDVAFHVTTAPSEPLIRKCAGNLSAGLRPVIVTTEDGVGGAKAAAKNAAIEDRIDIIEIEQFIATNVYEWSVFRRAERGASVKELVDRYNAVVADNETDPSLRIDFDFADEE